jgi:hypothetical protein
MGIILTDAEARNPVMLRVNVEGLGIRYTEYFFRPNISISLNNSIRGLSEDGELNGAEIVGSGEYAINADDPKAIIRSQLRKGALIEFEFIDKWGLNHRFNGKVEYVERRYDFGFWMIVKGVTTITKTLPFENPFTGGMVGTVEEFVDYARRNPPEIGTRIFTPTNEPNLPTEYNGDWVANEVATMRRSQYEQLVRQYPRPTTPDEKPRPDPQTFKGNYILIDTTWFTYYFPHDPKEGGDIMTLVVAESDVRNYWFGRVPARTTVKGYNTKTKTHRPDINGTIIESKLVSYPLYTRYKKGKMVANEPCYVLTIQIDPPPPSYDETIVMTDPAPTQRGDEHNEL